MRELIVGRYYRHFKGGLYFVIGTAIDTETGKYVVIYHNLEGQKFVRPYDSFMSKVDHNKYPDSKKYYRFTLVR